MQEFLSINSGDCTYFGRKPLTKSRIDKVTKQDTASWMWSHFLTRKPNVSSDFLSKMVENALGTLRTAFPRPELLSPVEDVDGDDGRIMDYRKYRWELHSSRVLIETNQKLVCSESLQTDYKILVPVGWLKINRWSPRPPLATPWLRYCA